MKVKQVFKPVLLLSTIMALYIISVNAIAQVQNKEGLPVHATSLPLFDLDQNSPNPFQTNTTIKYYLKNATEVSLKVYNLLGKEVITLVNQKQSIGPHSVVFNGSALTEGVYYYQIKIDGIIETKRMIISK
jgi:outer membrane receptor protein involved in Fe transport